MIVVRQCTRRWSRAARRQPMHRAAVVPDDDVARLPFVPVLGVGLQHVPVELGQQAVALCFRHADDVEDMRRIDIERLAPGLRMHAHHVVDQRAAPSDPRGRAARCPCAPCRRSRTPPSAARSSSSAARAAPRRLLHRCKQRVAAVARDFQRRIAASPCRSSMSHGESVCQPWPRSSTSLSLALLPLVTPIT